MIFLWSTGTGKTTTIINMINEMYKDTNDTTGHTFECVR